MPNQTNQQPAPPQQVGQGGAITSESPLVGLILRNLRNNGPDFVSQITSSALVADMVRPEIPKLAFPAVMGELGKYLSDREKCCCREVCKTWKEGVDKFNEQR